MIGPSRSLSMESGWCRSQEMEKHCGKMSGDHFEHRCWMLASIKIRKEGDASSKKLKPVYPESKFLFITSIHKNQ